MHKDINLTLSPRDASNEISVKRAVAKRVGCTPEQINGCIIKRRSIDARKQPIKINLLVEIWVYEPFKAPKKVNLTYPDVSEYKECVIIGTGPAGLFAALRLIERGIRPIMYERGKSVDDRKSDISNIHNREVVNPDSNYGYGEGGAGTFSDGKLYTRSKKRGNIKNILETLHFHGAQDSILIDAHPHIGTNVLPKVVKAIRETILKAGGEIHFNSRVTDITVKGSRVESITLQSGEKREIENLILATGHSAKDIYGILHKSGVKLESKSFAMGVRLEHPQTLIDSIQYHGAPRGQYLPAATYSLVEQILNRGVYSFCMCPGGVVVPAATSPNELVVNGMSASDRGGKFANAGMVVEIQPEDIPTDIPLLESNTLNDEMFNDEIFAGLKFQSYLEQLCFKQAGESQHAPAQRMEDFITGELSETLPETSYRPGIVSSPMHEWIPEVIYTKLKRGFIKMGRKAEGFLTNEATVIGVESRTSSPIRVPRDEKMLNHVDIKNLYPCGEGSGYAGGIVSSAVDGERCADMIQHR